VSVGLAHAKLNLALVVGPQRSGGKHELITVFQRVAIVDRIALVPAGKLEIVGFEQDTLVRDALLALSERAGIELRWRVRIDKTIPVAAGLGGGSSDAAAALRLVNATLQNRLDESELAALARPLGADIPFFLTNGPQLGQEDGGQLRSLELPQDYSVLLLFPVGEEKRSTADVYRAFDERGGSEGFERRRQALVEALATVREARDLRALPPNDLATSPHTERLLELGAFRADASGAGPVVYGLFEQYDTAAAAAEALASLGEVRLTRPAW